MGKPTKKNKTLAYLVAGATLLVLLGVIGSAVWSMLGTRVQQWHENNAKIAAEWAEKDRLARIELRKRAASDVPLATIQVSFPATRPAIVTRIPLATASALPSRSIKRPASSEEPSLTPVRLSSPTRPELIALATVSVKEVNAPSMPVKPVPSKPVASASPERIAIATVSRKYLDTPIVPGKAEKVKPASTATPEKIALATVSTKYVDSPSRKLAPAQAIEPEGQELLQPITLAAPAKGKAIELAVVPAWSQAKPTGLSLATVENIKKQIPPQLEIDRENAEGQLSTALDTVKIVTGFECSTPLIVEKLSSTHFALTITTDSTLRNWFMFRVEGAKGKTVRIDIKDAPLWKWKTLNPVYSYSRSLDDPAEFVSMPTKLTHFNAYNGPLLPDTTEQKWHFIPNVWIQSSPAEPKSSLGIFSFTKFFENDGAFVAMKTPYTPVLNERYLSTIKNVPGAECIRVGSSQGGRPLTLVKISNGEDSEKRNPCIVMYAREHADEHDSSWVTQGAIDYLLSDQPDARALRDRFTFLVIPLVDPDGAVVSVYEGITKTFADGSESDESLAYASWFKRWVDAGKRLDLVLNLHNVESAEGPHLFCALMETRRMSDCQALHRFVYSRVSADGFIMSLPADNGYMSTRLGGFLSENYGALHLLYEVNSQAPARHLNLRELRDIGRLLVLAASDCLNSSEGKELVAKSNADRMVRDSLWNKYKVVETNWDIRTPFSFENALRSMPHVQRSIEESGRPIPAWFKPLYANAQNNGVTPGGDRR